MENWDRFVTFGGPCIGGTFPEGWGGDITDSFVDEKFPVWDVAGVGDVPEGCFSWGIAPGEQSSEDLKISRIEDPSWYIAFVDGGLSMTYLWLNAQGVIFPDLCKLWCAECAVWFTGGAPADWANCPWSQDCGIGPGLWPDKMVDWAIDNGTRHLGGNNIGFMDGHATWMHARAIMAEAPRSKQGGYITNGGTGWRKLRGLVTTNFLHFGRRRSGCRHSGGLQPRLRGRVLLLIASGTSRKGS